MFVGQNLLVIIKIVNSRSHTVICVVGSHFYHLKWYICNSTLILIVFLHLLWLLLFRHLCPNSFTSKGTYFNMFFLFTLFSTHFYYFLNFHNENKNISNETNQIKIQLFFPPHPAKVLPYMASCFTRFHNLFIFFFGFVCLFRVVCYLKAPVH